MNSTPQNCCICDFPIDPFADSGWFSHVCSAEYLLLQNIYSERDLAHINIASLEEFVAKVKKMLDCLPAFCDSIEFENFKSMRHLGNIDKDLDGLLTETQNVKVSAAATNTFQTEQEKGKLSKKQVLGYLCKTSIRHQKNANINVDAPYTDNFLSNLAGIAEHKLVVHHSHISGQIIGFAHTFCNLKVRENYYVIPVIAHNQFRFDFFFFMQGYRPTVWESTDVQIGAKNPSNITYAMISGQVRFIDIIKYFQQSLVNLAASMNDEEREFIRSTFDYVLQDRLPFCLPEDRHWILDYLARGKGMIPYQKITDFESLKVHVPRGEEFFNKDDFYSTLMECSISDKDYGDVKKFFTLLDLKTLGDLNRYYNIQDTLILCAIFEQRVDMLQRLFKFNPRKCNSASAFSDYVHRDKNKCNIVLPRKAETVRLFEKILIGGYSGINTSLAFDTDLFLKDPENERVLFTDGDGEVKRFSSKIAKMDENNQYGFAMTKPLPYRVIKKQKTVPTLDELKRMLADIMLEDKVGHLFVVDVVFEASNDKTLLFNKLYPPIFEKQKKLEAYERSCTQIMSVLQLTDKGKMSTLQHTAKTHATLKKTVFLPLYAEDLQFITTKMGWGVTKIYEHYTFRQETFKREFVTMNQNARKTAKTKVEKDFYKLLNNSNFGFDCRQNTDDCKIELLYDGAEEVRYIKNYSNIFSDYKLKEFFTEDALHTQVEKEIDEKINQFDVDDEFYVANEAEMLELKNEDFEAIDGYLRSNKRKRGKSFNHDKKVDTIENEIEKSNDLRKNKTLVELNTPAGTAVKQIALKPQTTMKCTSHFLAGKMLMFAKLSLKSFIYQLAKLFMFPDATVHEIYDRYRIDRVYVYHVLTDTDSTCIQFLVISSIDSTFTESYVRDIIFKVFSRTPIVDRFDKSHQFWKRFGVHDESNQKVLELYDVESIDDPCYVTLAVNPKEYFEYFKSQNTNKKHKGIKKGTPGMNCDNFAERIKPLHSFE